MKNRLIEQEVYAGLPAVLKEITDNFDGREKDIVLLSSLGVLSNCLPNLYGVYDGDIIFPNLYVLIVAPPASGKGVMNYSRALIERIHSKVVEDSKNEKATCLELKKKEKDKKDDSCPDLQLKIVPANISTSELYTFMGNSKHGLLIMESEADTLSNMLKNDWSNYSDVLRKAFHHEPLSIARKVEDLYEEIPEPKLSMVISGTPGQLKPFLKSKENGLFSRFIMYTFDEISEFKNVFDAKTNNNRQIFNNAAQYIFDLYGNLSILGSTMKFEYTPEQQEIFLNEMTSVWGDIIDTHTEAFLPNLNRHALIQFRIAMIISVLRGDSPLEDNCRLVCSDDDFALSSKLMLTLLRHSQTTFDSIESGILSILDEDVLDDLPRDFTREQIVAVAKQKDIPTRTIDDKLAQWQVKKVIKKVSRGNYRKS